MRYRPGSYTKPLPKKNGCVHQAEHGYDITKVMKCSKATYDQCLLLTENGNRYCVAYFDSEPDIKPYSPLVFDVELIDFK